MGSLYENPSAVDRDSWTRAAALMRAEAAAPGVSPEARSVYRMLAAGFAGAALRAETRLIRRASRALS